MPSSNKSLTLFIDRPSWVQCLHPFTKLCYILLTGVVVYAGAGRWKFSLLLVVCNLLVAASVGLFLPVWRSLVKIMLPLVIFMVPIHGFFYPGNRTPLSLWGVEIYREGLLFAANTLSHLAAIVAASLLFVFTTSPAKLITAIAQAGGSPSLAYILGSPLLLVATLRERVRCIQSAQQARGLDTRGNILRRFISLAPLVIPLVIGALVSIEQRAIALEIRGFNSPGPKTSLNSCSDSTVQYLARWLMGLLCIVISLYRIFT